MANRPPSSPRSLLGWLVLALALASCASGVSVRGFGTRASLALVDTFETDLTVLGYTASDDSDYSNLEFGVYTRVVNEEDEDLGRLDASVGLVRFAEFEAVEWSVGGRVYFAESYTLRPFAGLSWVFTAFDDARVQFLDLDIGVMQSARLSLGTEVILARQLHLDILLDYSIPISGANFTATAPAPLPSVDGELEMEGLTLKIGIGIDF